MIPKIIHYCWFGKNEKSGMINECIASWKKYMPDYEIIEWNETNVDINSNLYVKQAYEAEKWAFVSDYARLYALYKCGGVYCDTDVEALKPFDEFLDNEAFTGFESKDSPITAVMGAEVGNRLIGEFMHYYDDAKFINDDGSYNMMTNTRIITKMLYDRGAKPNGRKQLVSGIMIYPQIFFCPNNLSRIWNKPSPKSYAIHHYEQSWSDSKRDQVSITGRVRRYAVGVLRNVLGTERVGQIKKEKK